MTVPCSSLSQLVLVLCTALSVATTVTWKHPVGVPLLPALSENRALMFDSDNDDILFAGGFEWGTNWSSLMRTNLVTGELTFPPAPVKLDGAVHCLTSIMGTRRGFLGGNMTDKFLEFNLDTLALTNYLFPALFALGDRVLALTSLPGAVFLGGIFNGMKNVAKFDPETFMFTSLGFGWIGQVNALVTNAGLLYGAGDTASHCANCDFNSRLAVYRQSSNLWSDILPFTDNVHSALIRGEGVVLAVGRFGVNKINGTERIVVSTVPFLRAIAADTSTGGYVVAGHSTSISAIRFNHTTLSIGVMDLTLFNDGVHTATANRKYLAIGGNFDKIDGVNMGNIAYYEIPTTLSPTWSPTSIPSATPSSTPTLAPTFRSSPDIIPDFIAGRVMYSTDVIIDRGVTFNSQSSIVVEGQVVLSAPLILIIDVVPTEPLVLINASTGVLGIFSSVQLNSNSSLCEEISPDVVYTSNSVYVSFLIDASGCDASNLALIAGATVGGVAVLVICIAIIGAFLHKRRHAKAFQNVELQLKDNK